ncbi:hypothetical protein BGZ70_004737, partial [Mortierella alpina]
MTRTLRTTRRSPRNGASSSTSLASNTQTSTLSVTKLCATRMQRLERTLVRIRGMISKTCLLKIASLPTHASIGFNALRVCHRNFTLAHQPAYLLSQCP